MSIFYKSNNKQHLVDSYYKAIDNNWHRIKNYYTKTNNGWKPSYLYNWEPSPWSACSVSCGGGVQSRTIKCKRNDGVYRDDIFCNNTIKPPLSQACNTHTCYPVNSSFDDCSNGCCGRGCGEFYTSYFLYPITYPTKITNLGSYQIYVNFNLGYWIKKDEHDGGALQIFNRSHGGNTPRMTKANAIDGWMSGKLGGCSWSGMHYCASYSMPFGILSVTESNLNNLPTHITWQGWAHRYTNNHMYALNMVGVTVHVP